MYNISRAFAGLVCFMNAGFFTYRHGCFITNVIALFNCNPKTRMFELSNNRSFSIFFTSVIVLFLRVIHVLDVNAEHMAELNNQQYFSVVVCKYICPVGSASIHL